MLVAVIVCFALSLYFHGRVGGWLENWGVVKKIMDFFNNLCHFLFGLLPLSSYDPIFICDRLGKTIIWLVLLPVHS